ncbi:13606_t:CDS:2, partial [Racocetra persica]
LKKKLHTCCFDPYLTVLMSEDIENVMVKLLEKWLKSKTPLSFVHIQKRQKETIAHVHFSTREEAGAFYYNMLGKKFEEPGDYNVKFTGASYYKFSNKGPITYLRPEETTQKQLLLVIERISKLEKHV